MLLRYAESRIRNSLDEIERLLQSDFPYTHSKDALRQLKILFERQRDVLRKIGPAPAASVLENACSNSLSELFLYVPILGFVLRSTNVRNAFEAYAPMLRLARLILAADTKLVVSSEWDYSPFVYLPMADLPGSVLMGLPAPESGNPLLLPLAGHELGHHVWQTQTLWSTYQDPVETQLLGEVKSRWPEFELLFPGYDQAQIENDMYARKTWTPAFTWAMLQLEEVFCDFFGLKMFGEAFLNAMAYLLSPGYGTRSCHYPNISERVQYLEQAATRFAVNIPTGYSQVFTKEDEPQDARARFLVSIADSVCQSQVNDLIDRVERIAIDRQLPAREPTAVKGIRRDFELVVPTEQATTVTDILNAGWECSHDVNLWKDNPNINEDSRDRVLHDLVLKSLEILEYQERIK